MFSVLHNRCVSVGLFAGLALGMPLEAHASVVVSTKPTQNMSCVSGVCTPTAKDAVLNVSDLATMLSGGDVTIQSASIAPDIIVKAALSWASTSRLTFDAYRSVEIDKSVTVTGTGAMTITTNDGGSGGDLSFGGKGNVTFWDLNSSLVINGQSYVLVGDIATLAADIASNPSGFYALAKDYDASADGSYSQTPISTPLEGVVEGLGNSISHMTIASNSELPDSGLFYGVALDGVLRDLGVVSAHVSGIGGGVLASANGGSIAACWSSGKIVASGQASGLVAGNGGTISRSYSLVHVYNGIGRAGGLVAYNFGTIDRSFASGGLGIPPLTHTLMGGLVGENSGHITNSYTLSPLHSRGGGFCDCAFGGLVGKSDPGATVDHTYAAGIFTNKGNDGWIGGHTGYDGASSGSISSSYWDLDKGVNDPSKGAGNIKNDPGITGLSDAQLKSGLPAGFYPTIWKQSAKLNNGYPYLVANPPPQ